MICVYFNAISTAAQMLNRLEHQLTRLERKGLYVNRIQCSDSTWRLIKEKKITNQINGWPQIIGALILEEPEWSFGRFKLTMGYPNNIQCPRRTRPLK